LIRKDDDLKILLLVVGNKIAGFFAKVPGGYTLIRGLARTGYSVVI